jgi:hypothetical protein
MSPHGDLKDAPVLPAGSQPVAGSIDAPASTSSARAPLHPGGWKTCMACRKRTQRLVIEGHGLYVCFECWDLDDYHDKMNEYYAAVFP